MGKFDCTSEMLENRVSDNPFGVLTDADKLSDAPLAGGGDR